MICAFNISWNIIRFSLYACWILGTTCEICQQPCQLNWDVIKSNTRRRDLHFPACTRVFVCPCGFSVTVDSEWSPGCWCIMNCQCNGSALLGEKETQPENTDKFPLWPADGGPDTVWAKAAFHLCRFSCFSSWSKRHNSEHRTKRKSIIYVSIIDAKPKHRGRCFVCSLQKYWLRVRH